MILTKIKKPFLFFFLFFLHHVNGQSQLSDTTNNSIDSFVKETIDRLGIPGVAIAIIKDNKTIYKKYTGTSNLEYDIPLTKESLFRLHSLSKIFVSTGIFQLAEKNKISIEDPISKYLDDLPEEWKNIQVKNLLSHSSGLPEIIEDVNSPEEIAAKNVYKKELQFPVGNISNYNQTNFWLLNRIIRKITNMDFSDFIATQFGETSNVTFSNTNDIVPKRVTEYKPDGKGDLSNSYFFVPDYMFGAAGITMTLENLIDWNAKLDNNELISETSKSKMLTPFEYKVGTGFTYGWDVQSLNGIPSYGFNGGGLVNYRNFPNKKISVIWFTNGYKTPYNVDQITNTLVGFIDKDLVDKTPEAAQLLYDAFATKSVKKAEKQYFQIKKDYPFVNFDGLLNNLGYAFLNKEDFDKAIAIFTLNTKEFPKSGNVFDSLAEAYFRNGQFGLSKENYEKSLELNPANTNAMEMLRKIEKEN
ncbi:serine hydrolase [Flagellimonas sp. 389]|uniref:serine hydrolase domain-containing protein n=1 Tax=Flagellimonas sp. 389 TaxID=2835862 RepID=UPI001BD59E36|nr:serine hydrolase domain-containing protein [Flagellimonas sp. 389]MBS9463824.1 serine hydrolase [Flagellimonas sp. 389]